MKLLITIDVECDHTRGYDEMVFGLCSDGSRWGIEYIAKTLSEHGLKGVFFLEPLGSKRYGTAGLVRAMETVFSYGHEVQLHLHPSFDGGPDALSQYDFETQVSLISTGKEILGSCGVKDLKAFRAGSFSANSETLEAVAKCKIPFDSSYNLSFAHSNCIIAGVSTFNNPIQIGEVWEFPVTCFNWPFYRLRNRYRHLQLTASGVSEFFDVLDCALRLNYFCVTILLHSFEFISRGRISTPNIKNIRRFETLCEALQQRSATISSVGFNDIIRAGIVDFPASDPKVVPKVKLSSWILRNLEQIAARLRGVG